MPEQVYVVITIILGLDRQGKAITGDLVGVISLEDPPNSGTAVELSVYLEKGYIPLTYINERLSSDRVIELLGGPDTFRDTDREHPYYLFTGTHSIIGMAVTEAVTMP